MFGSTKGRGIIKKIGFCLDQAKREGSAERRAQVWINRRERDQREESSFLGSTEAREIKEKKRPFLDPPKQEGPTKRRVCDWIKAYGKESVRLDSLEEEFT